MDSGLVAPAPTGASGPKLCLGLNCGEALAQPGRKPRQGKRFCSSACRGSAWKIRTFGKAATVSNADFGTLREIVDRVVKEHRSRHPEHVIVGYVLRHLSPVGPVDFPEPGRATKRAPDKNGVWRMSAEAFYAIEPFEFPRVPVVADYEILLRDQSGNLHRTLNWVRVFVAFPSVRLYDAKFHYDYKGRIVWANDAPRVKPRRRRQSRRIEDVTPSQTERELVVTNTPPTPTATATGATHPATQPEVRASTNESQTAELARKLEQVSRELSRVQQELSRIQRERDDDRLRFRAQKAELDEVKGLNKLLLYRNKRLQAERLPEGVGQAAPATFANSQNDEHGTVALAPSVVEVTIPTEAPIPVEVALQNELSMPIAPVPPSDPGEQPLPVAPIEEARQDALSSLTPPEPTPHQSAETRAPPAPKTDPPKPDWKSGGKSKQRGKPTPPKKPPNGPLFGLAADNWRTSHRIR